MEYTCDRWQENESVQAEQAAFENNGIRRQGKEYVKPFERMLDELDNWTIAKFATIQTEESKIVDIKCVS